MKLAHATAVCETFDNAIRFYSGVLGLKAIKDFTLNAELTDKLFAQHRDCRIILFQGKEIAIEVFIHPDPPIRRSPYAHLCLAVDDLDFFLGRCRENKVKIKQVPKGKKLLTFVEDFDGNLFEIKT